MEQCFMSARQGTNDELVSEWKHDMTSAGEGRKNDKIKVGIRLLNYN
jgi:hypothetical protein